MKTLKLFGILMSLGIAFVSCTLPGIPKPGEVKSSFLYSIMFVSNPNSDTKLDLVQYTNADGNIVTLNNVTLSPADTRTLDLDSPSSFQVSVSPNNTGTQLIFRARSLVHSPLYSSTVSSVTFDGGTNSYIVNFPDISLSSNMFGVQTGNYTSVISFPTEEAVGIVANKVVIPAAKYFDAFGNPKVVIGDPVNFYKLPVIVMGIFRTSYTDSRDIVGYQPVVFYYKLAYDDQGNVSYFDITLSTIFF